MLNTRKGVPQRPMKATNLASSRPKRLILIRVVSNSPINSTKSSKGGLATLMNSFTSVSGRVGVLQEYAVT